jgi:hypothetical protein
MGAGKEIAMSKQDIDWLDKTDMYPLWTSGGNLKRKLREFAHRYHSAQLSDSPSYEMNALVDEFTEAISAMFAAHYETDKDAKAIVADGKEEENE